MTGQVAGGQPWCYVKQGYMEFIWQAFDFSRRNLLQEIKT